MQNVEKFQQGKGTEFIFGKEKVRPIRLEPSLKKLKDGMLRGSLERLSRGQMPQKCTRKHDMFSS
jgi:hypothetical protein